WGILSNDGHAGPRPVAHRGGRAHRPRGRGDDARTAPPVARPATGRLRPPARRLHALLPARYVDPGERRADDPPQSLRPPLRRAKMLTPGFPGGIPRIFPSDVAGLRAAPPPCLRPSFSLSSPGFHVSEVRSVAH